MTHLTIFACRADGACLLESLERALELFPPERVQVIEDQRNPLTEGHRAAVEGMGAGIRSGNTPYPKTLQQAILVLREHARTFEITGASHVISLDADTIIKDPAPLLEAIEAGYVAASWGCPHHHFYGCCYMLSERGVREALENVQNCLPMLRRDAMSDAFIGFMMDRTFGHSAVKRFWFDVRGGFCKNYWFQSDTIPLEEYARRYAVVSFGRRDGMRGVRDGFAHAAEVMARFRRMIGPAGAL